MTSTSGLVGNLGQANLGGEKLGIVGLSKSIALDMAEVQGALELHLAFCVEPHDRLHAAETDEQRARVEKLKAMETGKIAPRDVPRLR